jgi:peptidoglycan hydrolase-like protein with peptidoglycan-binding domain
MAVDAQMKQQAPALAPAAQARQAGPGATQAAGGLKRQLAGLDYSSQVAMLAPTAGGGQPVQAKAGAPASEAAQAPSGAAASEAAQAPSGAPAAEAAQAPSGASASRPSMAGGQRPDLSVGMSHFAVVDLQSLLNRCDEVVQQVALDGNFGPSTLTAVRQFQTAHNVTPSDGVVRAATWDALDRAIAEAQDPTALARKLFERGAAAYEKGMFAHAYDLFTSSYEQAARPGLLFSRAQCLRKLGGRNDDAIALYEQYLGTGDGKRDKDSHDALKELRGPAKSGDEEIDTPAAKKLFDRGTQLYEAGQYAHAYDEFTKSDRLADRPGLKFSRAQALRKLGGRAEEAIALYEAHIAAGGNRSAEAAGYVAQLRAPEKSGDEDKDTKTGKAIFDEGEQAYAAKSYGKAYDLFTRAHKLTSRAGLLWSRAQCLRQLGGRREEAIELYESYIADGSGKNVDRAHFYVKELREQGVLKKGL